MFVPKNQQDHVDAALVGCSDPDWLIDMFQEWNCTEQNIAALKQWIRIYQYYGYSQKSLVLTEFALQHSPADPFLLAQYLILFANDAVAFDTTLNRLLAASLEETFKTGVALQNKQQHRQASEVFEKIIEQCPTRATAWTHLALSYAELKRWNQANEIFSHALELDPFNPFLVSSYEEYQKKQKNIKKQEIYLQPSQ